MCQNKQVYVRLALKEAAKFTEVQHQQCEHFNNTNVFEISSCAPTCKLVVYFDKHKNIFMKTVYYKYVIVSMYILSVCNFT